MKVIKPSHEIMTPENPYKHIEKVGRICYKSEDMITDTSAETFVKRLFDSKHHAMLEHFRFIFEISEYAYNMLISNRYSKYLTFTDDGRFIVSASARGLNDMYAYNIINNGKNKDIHTVIDIIYNIVNSIAREYKCPEIFDPALIVHQLDNYKVHIIKDFSELNDNEYKMHAWYSIHFVCDRGVTHEIVRHRDASFAQESTRYCNYNKGKYDGEITVIEPLFWDRDENPIKYGLWRIICKLSEHHYMKLINTGATPQEARSVLPNSLKSEIVVTAQVYEWIHIFNLRAYGITGAPHPQMKEIMLPACEDMLSNGYIREEI